jgi:hypothetical protein
MKIAPEREEDASKPIKLLTKTATTENKEDTEFRNKEMTEGVTGSSPVGTTSMSDG